MNPKNAKQEFENRLKEASLSTAGLTLMQGAEAMLGFYREVRAKGCDPAEDADMLLYQWGLSNEKGEFEVDVTRQLTFDGSGDEHIWQLSLTFKYAPTEDEAPAPGNKWLSKPHPKAVEHFDSYIKDSPAYQQVVGKQPSAVELSFFNAG